MKSESEKPPDNCQWCHILFSCFCQLKSLETEKRNVKVWSKSKIENKSDNLKVKIKQKSRVNNKMLSNNVIYFYGEKWKWNMIMKVVMKVIVKVGINLKFRKWKWKNAGWAIWHLLMMPFTLLVPARQLKSGEEQVCEQVLAPRMSTWSNTT